MEEEGDGSPVDDKVLSQKGEGENDQSKSSPDKSEDQKEKSSNEEDDFEGDEETEEDKLALKKAQSLSLEDQEKAAQGTGHSSYYPKKKGGNKNGYWKGKNKGRRSFSRKRNKKNR